jgi:predicted Fe-Mo cluster-binding NifX family protein
MKIAVAFQNGKTITGHAGRCRKFLVFDVNEKREVTGTDEMQFERGVTFHDLRPGGENPLQGCDVMIAGSMGGRLVQKLLGFGVKAVVTEVADPAIAVKAYLDGTLPELDACGGHEDHPLHDHSDGHGHGHGEGHGDGEGHGNGHGHGGHHGHGGCSH